MMPTILSENHFQTLKLIVGQFQREQIVYQITGGLAGNIYGSQWPLHDIDIEVQQKDLETVAKLFSDFIIRPLDRFIDEEFDLMLLTLRINQVEVDINQVEDSFVFSQGVRVKLDTDLSKANCIDFLGLEVWVQPLEDVIAYKKLLNRQADLLDLIELRSREC